jgi:hypothetical protein
MAPYGSHPPPICCTWLPYGAHGSQMASIHPMRLPYGDICLPWGMQLPYSSYGSHTAHAAPIWHHLPPTWSTYLPYGVHMAHVVPIWCMQLLHGTINLSCGYIWLSYGAHRSIQCQLLCGPISGRCSHKLPSASHMVQTAPIWLCVVDVAHLGSRGPIGCMVLLYGSIHHPCVSIWLPYGTFGSQTAHTNPIWPHLGVMQLSDGAIRLPYGNIWLPHGPMAHMAPAWHTWIQHGAHGSRMVPTQCMWLSYGTSCLLYGAHSTHAVHTALL